MMRVAPRPKSVGKAPEVRLIDGVQHLDDGPLEVLAAASDEDDGVTFADDVR
jgi:hypothetical protein